MKKTLFKTNRSNRHRAGTLIFCASLVLPLKILAAAENGGGFHLPDTNAIIMAILAANFVLFIGLMFRLQSMRTKLLQKTASLEKSETHIRLMGDNLPNTTIFQLSCTNDNQFAFNFLSKGSELVMGVNRDQMMKDAHLAFDHVYESDIPALQTAFRQAKSALAPAQLEIRVLDSTGNLKWLHISAVPHQDRNKLVWDGLMQDITSTKSIETSLVEEMHNFQNLFETIDDFMLVCDMNGNLLHSNPSVENRLEYSREELKDMSIYELYPDHLRAEVYHVIARMQSEKSTSCAMPLQMKSGSTIPVEMHIFQGTWKSKQAIFSVARDVAGRQQTETALRESQQMLQLIMNTIPMSVFWKDKDSIYLGCNKTFIAECGLETIDEVIGKTPFDLYDPQTAEAVIQRDQQMIESNQPQFNALHAYARSDGSSGWRETSKIPLHDNTNNAVGVLGVWRDVTEQKRAEERLKRTLEDMERFNQLMRGRERRTLELKEEINELLKDQGQPIKYRTTSENWS